MISNSHIGSLKVSAVFHFHLQSINKSNFQQQFNQISMMELVRVSMEAIKIENYSIYTFIHNH